MGFLHPIQATREEASILLALRRNLPERSLGGPSQLHQPDVLGRVAAPGRSILERHQGTHILTDSIATRTRAILSELGGSPVRSRSDTILLSGLQQVLEAAAQSVELIVELVVRAFGGRALNGAVGAPFGNVSVSAGVGAVAEQLPVAEGTAQLGVLGEKVVVENTGLLALVAWSTAPTRARNAHAVTKLGHRATTLLAHSNLEIIREQIVIVRVTLDDESTGFAEALLHGRLCSG